jgi:hypothetical protein
VSVSRDLIHVRLTYDWAAGFEETSAPFDERVPFLQGATGVGGIRRGCHDCHVSADSPVMQSVSGDAT